MIKKLHFPTPNLTRAFMQLKALGIFSYLILMTFIAHSQTEGYILISGEIVNISMKPISFVNVISTFSSKGTFSDEKGKFKFKALKNDTIIFMAISFKTKKMAVNQLLNENNLVFLDSMVYTINKVDVMDFRWKEFEHNMINMKLKPMEQKILVIKGLPDPYTVLTPIKPNIVSNPITAIYDFFKPENVRRRKLARWKETYNNTWIKSSK